MCVSAVPGFKKSPVKEIPEIIRARNLYTSSGIKVIIMAVMAAVQLQKQGMSNYSVRLILLVFIAINGKTLPGTTDCSDRRT
jgi:hypothetical protein